MVWAGVDSIGQKEGPNGAETGDALKRAHVEAARKRSRDWRALVEEHAREGSMLEDAWAEEIVWWVAVWPWSQWCRRRIRAAERVGRGPGLLIPCRVEKSPLKG